MGDSAESFTEQEVEAFAHKLSSWGETLQDREQQLLSGLVESAAQGSGGDDTSGYFFGVGLAVASAMQRASIAQTPTTGLTKQDFVSKQQTKSGLSSR